MSEPFGASKSEWTHFDLILGLGADLLPVVSNPHATISPKSKMKALGKTPSLYNGGRMVVGIPQWTQHRASDIEIDRWSTEPDLGICIQTRELGAFDLDLSDRRFCQLVASRIDRELGIDLPRRMRGNSPKRLLAFRLKGDFPKRVIRTQYGAIEFLGRGNQFVAAGTHPSGARYEWPGGLPGEIPEITPEQFERAWARLVEEFAIEPPTTAGDTARQRGEHLDLPDPVADFLEEKGLALGEQPDGSILIQCPWDADHTGGEPGDGSTAWFRAGSNGYDRGHFKCLHAHCEGRTDGDFFASIGYQEDVSQMFEDLGPDAEAEQQKAERKGRFAVVPVSDVALMPPMGWIIKGVLPWADLGMVYGPSGSGKSFVLIDMAMCIARGVPWMGHKVKKMRVVYICAEGAQGFRSRLKAYALHHQIDLSSVDMGVISAAPNFLTVKDVLAVRDAIEAGQGAGVIIIDTLARVTPGANENTSEDMGLAISNCQKISTATGAMIVLVHHSGKDVAKGARGWSGMGGANDATLEVVRDEASGKRWVDLGKLKEGEDRAQWGFRLEQILVDLDEDGDPITSCVAVPDAAPAIGRGARLRGEGRKLGAWEAAVMETHAELAVGGDVLLTEMVIRAAGKMPDAGSVKSRRARVRRALKGLSTGSKAILIVEDGMVFER